ncbi:MAG TPA: peptide ABC transporter permease [Betaproteobacteria bacterium]|nr:peptide ABC transporter permease [Betaproteobacteria bacterium]
MGARDFLSLAFSALGAHRLRTTLTVLGIAVGIAAVIILTSIGEGLHRFVLAEFSQFGANLIAIQPGRAITHGGPVGIFGTVRPLTLDDAEARRRAPWVQLTVPFVQGNAAIKAHGKSRRTTIYGVGPDFPQAFHMPVGIGRFLPHDDPRAARPFAVLGSKVKQELFGNANPLGERIRIGGNRFRVIGVMAPKGQVLGFDMDDTAYLPAGRALELFNREGLIEIDVVYDPLAPLDRVVAGVRRVLLARHGREDFTITPQQKMLDVLGSVLDVLTFAVAAIGGVSLLVGGVGILTIMTIAVTERTNEIGLLRALGAKRGQVLALFLGEAVLLAAVGGLTGLAAGAGLTQLLHGLFPALPVHTPWTYALLAEAVAVLIGLTAGSWPARRAARLDPVEALRAE